MRERKRVGAGSPDNVAVYNKHDKGILTKIIEALKKESADSVYRFWLSACVENFLRGCGSMGQVFVAESGLLQNTWLLCTFSHADDPHCR